MESIELNVDSRNQIAIKLYESAGFQEVFRKRFWIPRADRMFSTGSTHEFIDRSDF
jgi:ribosomal protein S18 acetylase RimI-like enzyme